MQDIFRYFIRKNFPEIGGELSNKDIDEIGEEFHKHLDSKLSEEQKKRILPNNAMDVIMKSEHPLKTNGFEPAYVLHAMGKRTIGGTGLVLCLTTIILTKSEDNRPNTLYLHYHFADSGNNSVFVNPCLIARVFY